MTVYTKGYEQQNIEEFVRQLQWNGVTLLVDVREIPISRKRGFSKTPISEYLSRNGIGYIHFKSLGSPTPMRRELHETGDYDRFFHVYRKYLEQHSEDLEQLKAIAHDEIVCLMCYEKDPSKCHRSVIVDELACEGDLEACHL